MSSCPCWIPAATSVVTSVLHALLLLAFYIMLSRKIAQCSSGMQDRSSPGERASTEPSPAPASAPGGDTAPKTGTPKPGAPKPGAPKPGAPKLGTHSPPAAYAGSSDTSSDTSEDSDSPSCPQGPGSGENLHYTSLVFPGKGHEPGAAQDYENVKTGMDYVNVDPKRKKMNFWPFSSSRASKGVEYTEVKL